MCFAVNLLAGRDSYETMHFKTTGDLNTFKYYLKVLSNVWKVIKSLI